MSGSGATGVTDLETTAGGSECKAGDHPIPHCCLSPVSSRRHLVFGSTGIRLRSAEQVPLDCCSSVDSANQELCVDMLFKDVLWLEDNLSAMGDHGAQQHMSLAIHGWPRHQGVFSLVKTPGVNCTR